MKSKKEKLTDQLVDILDKYTGEPFSKVEPLIRKDCEDFLISLGIQRALLPEIIIALGRDGFVEIKMGAYPKPTPMDLN